MPVIVQSTDYYPYGMTMPGRNWTSASDKYRYGYQGSEINQETHGNSNQYTTEFRQLDARFGRWFSPDPKFAPSQSPYCSMNGDPINLNDPMGDWPPGSGDGDKGKVVDLPNNPAWDMPQESPNDIEAPKSPEPIVVDQSPTNVCYYSGKSYYGNVDFPNHEVGNTWLGKVFLMDRFTQPGQVKGDGKIKVNHSGFLTIDGETGEVIYHEYGRYDWRTAAGDPLTQGRDSRTRHYWDAQGHMQSSYSVEKLKMKTKPRFDAEGNITNMDAILEELRDKDVFYNYGQFAEETGGLVQADRPYGTMVVGVIEITSDQAKAINQRTKDREAEGNTVYGAPIADYCSGECRRALRSVGFKIPWGIWYGEGTNRYLEKKYNGTIFSVPADPQKEQKVIDYWNNYYQENGYFDKGLWNFKGERPYVE